MKAPGRLPFVLLLLLTVHAPAQILELQPVDFGDSPWGRLALHDADLLRELADWRRIATADFAELAGWRATVEARLTGFDTRLAPPWPVPPRYLPSGQATVYPAAMPRARTRSLRAGEAYRAPPEPIRVFSTP